MIEPDLFDALYMLPAYSREVSGGRTIAVYRQLFNARLQIGPTGAMYYKTHW